LKSNNHVWRNAEVCFEQVDKEALARDLETENVSAPTNGRVGCFFGKVVFKCLPVLGFSIKENIALFRHMLVVLCCFVADDPSGVVVREHNV
jgi:hypothetical protein